MTIRSGHGAAALLASLIAGAASAQTQTAPAQGRGENDPRRAPAAAASNTYPPAAAGNGATTGGYNLSRWAEDWSGLRDPAKRTDWIDRLKYLPIDGDGDVFLTLSGELRLRVNHTTNPNLRDARAQRQDIRRVVAGADLHLGPHLRAFGEIAHGGISGVELGAPAATLRNALVVQQAFVEGDAEIAGVATGLRVGRQEFSDGPNLFVSQRDNNTIRYTLNGWRAWAQGSTMRIDLFDFKPTQYGDLGAEDDVIDPERRFSGMTLGLVVPRRWFGGSRLYVDPFLWRRRNRVGAWGDRVGPATRYYAGVHAWGDVGRLTVDWTVSHQWGRFIAQDLDAWHVLLAQSWQVDRGPARSASASTPIMRAVAAVMARASCATPMPRSATTSTTATGCS